MGGSFIRLFLQADVFARRQQARPADLLYIDGGYEDVESRYRFLSHGRAGRVLRRRCDPGVWAARVEVTNARAYPFVPTSGALAMVTHRNAVAAFARRDSR